MVRTPKVEELEDGRIMTTYYIGNDPLTLTSCPNFRIVQDGDVYYPEKLNDSGLGYHPIIWGPMSSYEEALEFSKKYVEPLVVRPEIKYHPVKL